MFHNNFLFSNLAEMNKKIEALQSENQALREKLALATKKPEQLKKIYAQKDALINAAATHPAIQESLSPQDQEKLIDHMVDLADNNSEAFRYSCYNSSSDEYIKVLLSFTTFDLVSFNFIYPQKLEIILWCALNKIIAQKKLREVIEVNLKSIPNSEKCLLRLEILDRNKLSLPFNINESVNQIINEFFDVTVKDTRSELDRKMDNFRNSISFDLKTLTFTFPTEIQEEEFLKWVELELIHFNQNNSEFKNVFIAYPLGNRQIKLGITDLRKTFQDLPTFIETIFLIPVKDSSSEFEKDTNQSYQQALEHICYNKELKVFEYPANLSRTTVWGALNQALNSLSLPFQQKDLKFYRLASDLVEIKKDEKNNLKMSLKDKEAAEVGLTLDHLDHVLLRLNIKIANKPTSIEEPRLFSNAEKVAVKHLLNLSDRNNTKKPRKGF